MKSQFKRVVSVMLMLVLLMSICTNALMTVSASTESTVQFSNVAYGKTVTFSYGAEVVSSDADYGVTAINSGLSVLTDGDNKNTNWWVNNGNPYVALKNSVVTGPYSFTVDLGSNYDTASMSVYSYARTSWGITPVDSVTFNTSTNGSTWSSAGTVSKENATVNQVPDPRYDNEIVDIYEYTLDVSATARYVKVTFATNAKGLVGIGEFEVYGEKEPSVISTNKSVSFNYGESKNDDANWGVSAIKSGLSVLTDGEKDNPNWWVNNGNPLVCVDTDYVTGPYEFVMNMGTLSSVKKVTGYFYDRSDWGVQKPDEVTFSVSGDGIKWTEAGTVSSASASYITIDDPRNPTAKKPLIYSYTLNTEFYDILYVKVTFNSNSVGCVAMQEFEVMGASKTDRNLALGVMANSNQYTYEVTGGGTGYEPTGTTKSNGSRYTVSEMENASLSRITDGKIINQSSVHFGAGWESKAWNNTSAVKSAYMEIYRNDSRIITMDLGSVRAISQMRMHFGALESSGIYAPTDVTYYVSEDGVNYYEIDEVTVDEATKDANDSNITKDSGATYSVPYHLWFSTSKINVNARYIKIIFPVNVYIFTDEVQVYGYDTTSATATALTEYELYDPYEGYVGHYATPEQSGGVKNEFMAYSGWYINSDGNEVYNTYKTVDEYMCAISYVDQNGTPQDWLFDDVTVMGHYYTARGTFNSYKAGYTSGQYYANKSDWYQWLCYAFGKDTSGNPLSYDGNTVINLNALEAAAKTAKETLNDPNYKVGVKLVIYPAVEYQENWGTLDGKKIDFTISGAGSKEAAIQNRLAAYQWYMDTAVQLWEEADFEHLELTGFYYYEETIHESTDRAALETAQQLTDMVRAHETPSTNTKASFDKRQGGRLYIYQLPYYQSEGYWNWAEYGFDYALMQPNYSFYDMYTITQLEECGQLCSYYGLGMQMEFGGTANANYISKFEDYLNYGDTFGYKDSILSWYMSTWGCYEMSQGKNGTRYLYDAVYEFVADARPEPQVVMGDVNQDGILDINDATDIQRYLVGLIELSESQLALADYDENSSINIKDVTKIQIKLAGLS